MKALHFFHHVLSRQLVVQSLFFPLILVDYNFVVMGNSKCSHNFAVVEAHHFVEVVVRSFDEAFEDSSVVVETGSPAAVEASSPAAVEAHSPVAVEA